MARFILIQSGGQAVAIPALPVDHQMDSDQKQVELEPYQVLLYTAQDHPPMALANLFKALCPSPHSVFLNAKSGAGDGLVCLNINDAKLFQLQDMAQKIKQQIDVLSVDESYQAQSYDFWNAVAEGMIIDQHTKSEIHPAGVATDRRQKGI